MGLLRRAGLCAAVAALTMALGGCGGGGASTGARFLPGSSDRINPIYDAMLVYPNTTLIIGGLAYQGVEIDLAIEFDEPTLRDADPAYTAEATVIGLSAGGVPQHYVVRGPLRIEGTLEGEVFSTGLFGGIEVGTANLLPDLTGLLGPARRRIVGGATLFGIADDGLFTAVKRRRYLVSGTDLQTIGKLSLIEVRYDNRFSVQNNLAVVSSDPVVRVEDDRPFVINRFSFDSLQGFNPIERFETSLEYSTGNGSNPHDVVVFPAREGGTRSGLPSEDGAGLAFVTRYEPPYNDVAVLDLDVEILGPGDSAVIDRIDLTPYALNSDGLPRADQAILHDGLIYVTLQDANARFSQFMTGRMVVIDPILREVIDVIDLEGQNPFESLVYSQETGLLYAAMAGIFGGLAPRSLSGGVEAIDPITRRSLGINVDDDDLGGNVSHVAVHSATLGYAVITDESYRNSLLAFDPSTGAVLGTILQDFDRIAAMPLDGDGYLIIAEGFFAPSYIILDAATATVVATLPAALPPFSIAILTRGL